MNLRRHLHVYKTTYVVTISNDGCGDYKDQFKRTTFHY